METAARTCGCQAGAERPGLGLGRPGRHPLRTAPKWSESPLPPQTPVAPTCPCPLPHRLPLQALGPRSPPQERKSQPREEALRPQRLPGSHHLPGLGKPAENPLDCLLPWLVLPALEWGCSRGHRGNLGDRGGLLPPGQGSLWGNCTSSGPAPNLCRWASGVSRWLEAAKVTPTSSAPRDHPWGAGAPPVTCRPVLRSFRLGAARSAYGSRGFSGPASPGSKARGNLYLPPGDQPLPGRTCTQWRRGENVGTVVTGEVPADHHCPVTHLGVGGARWGLGAEKGLHGGQFGVSSFGAQACGLFFDQIGHPTLGVQNG